MTYATVDDIQDRLMRDLDADERRVCGVLLADAAQIIDAYSATAAAERKKLVSTRMVLRVIGDGGAAGGVPIGATQSTVSALGYSQSWTIGSGGSSGELYLSRADKKLLGVGAMIGSSSPVEALGVRRCAE